MTDEPETERTAAQGNHAGQWGLAAILLSCLVIIFFPIMAIAILAVLLGAWQINEVELRHIEFAELGIRIVTYGLLALAVLALICGVMGLVRAVRRGQPYGLSIAGTPTAV